MLTTAQPIVEIAKDTYEIDEFDCGSIFVLVGKDKAMVIEGIHLEEKTGGKSGRFVFGEGAAQ